MTTAPVSGTQDRFPKSPPTGSSLWIVHGSGTTDTIVDHEYAALDFEAALCIALRADGFERVVYSSLSFPIYYRDQQSRNLSRADRGASAGTTVGTRPERRMRHGRGPLGRQIVFGRAMSDILTGATVAATAGGLPEGQAPGTPAARAAGQAAAPPPRTSSAIDDPARVQQLKWLMGDPKGPRTAVVLANAETLLNQLAPSAHRDLAAAFDDWLTGRHRPGNLVVLLFSPDSMNDIADGVDRLGYLTSLAHRLGRIRDGHHSSEVLHVGTPREPELRRLLEATRGRHGLQLDWLETDLLVREMAAERSRTARDWLGALESLREQPISRQLLRERGLLTGSSADDRSALQRLDEMIGLQPVKKFLRTRQARLAAGAALGRGGRSDAPALHLVFLGNPGTGKTTVAKLVGEMYRDLGLLASGHVVPCVRADLVADHIGGTAVRTRALIDDAMDGVLFVDEAYQLLAEGDPFGQEAIGTLLTEMENRRDRLVVIVAGYPEEMQGFLRANPGLESRFPVSNRITFPDYSAEELEGILSALLVGESLDLGARLEETDGVETEAVETVQDALAAVTRGVHAAAGQRFGNGREMRSLFDEIMDAWAGRTHPLPGEALPALSVLDIPERFRGHLTRRPVTEAEILARLEAMTGLKEVKQLLRELVAQLLLRERRGRAAPTPPHLLFVGAPGTGKTTVARLVGELFASMHLLRSGHLVEAKRADLVAQHIGQTAPRTRQKISDAVDGVLFIDEAYDLARGGEQDFGSEAIAELIAQMEDNRERLVVIAAGYEDRMVDFLDANEGLASRFSTTIHFADYTITELVEILKTTAAASGLMFGPGALNRATHWLKMRRSVTGPAFGNAREVRELVDRMERRAAARLAPILDEVSEDRWNELTVSDVPEAVR